ncbi:MAG: DUF3999 domain-containing protein [Thermoguttaceae bacterium]|nr:DUF3999 domain-containing protein [Thermoguttaceae bacterium]
MNLWAGALLVALLILCATALGAPDAAAPSGTEVPAQWREVGSVEKRIEVLEFLAAQSEANYEKLRTWRATYSILGDMEHSAAYLQDRFKTDRPLRWQVKGTVQLVVDKESEATYYRYDRQSHQRLDLVTRKPVEDPDLSRLPWDRVVVTPESHLHAHYGRAFGLLPEVQSRPDLYARPLAYRDPRSQADDPLKGFRIYSFFTFVDREWVWEDLRREADLLRREDPKWKDLWRQATKIYESKAGNGNWYKYDFEYTSPEGRQTSRRMLFSAAAGYLPVEDLNESKPAADAKSQGLRHRVWQWKKFDGVYVPSYFKEVMNTGGESGPDTEEQVLLQCEVNKPIDPVQFTWAGMDLPEGTVVMDRVEGAAYLWERGKLNRLPGASEASGARAGVNWLRWVLAGVTLGAVALVGVVAWRRRRGNRIPAAR